jgi:hypothetical protein
VRDDHAPGIERRDREAGNVEQRCLRRRRGGPVAERGGDEVREPIVRRVADRDHRRVGRRVHTAVKRHDVVQPQRLQCPFGADRQVAVRVIAIEILREQPVRDRRGQVAELYQAVEGAARGRGRSPADPGAGF